MPERLVGASLSALHLRLQEPFHVLHFIGHGSFLQDQDEGVLLFENEGGKGEDPAAGSQLAALLGDQSSLRLVVLNTCEGAVDSLKDPFGGVAQGLVRSGLPAVIAMRSRFSDRAAIAFASSFYGALARGQPVEAALSMARRDLFAKHFELEWAIPVLYLRSPDGIIIRPSWRPWGWWLRMAGIAAGAVALGLSLLVGERLLTDGSQHQRDIGAPPAQSRGSSEGCPPLQELGIELRRIAPGTFTMGEKGEGKEARSHVVILTKPFCISVHEITQGQWQAVMQKNPSAHPGDDRRPVERVSWHDIQDFLRRLAEREPAANFRLPTEAQWEYASRAGSMARFSFGDDPVRLYLFGNCESRGWDDGHDGPAPVGSFAPNNWGLYDMHGNVSEWVADWYGPYGSQTGAGSQGAASWDRTSPAWWQLRNHC